MEVMTDDAFSPFIALRARTWTVIRKSRHISHGRRYPMTGQHLITTPPTSTIHTRCGAPVIEGHAEGLHARVDLNPLNQAGEIQALCDGLQTYTLTTAGLIHRDATRIAGGLTGPILADHRCRRTIPAHHRAATPAADETAPTEGIPY